MAGGNDRLAPHECSTAEHVDDADFRNGEDERTDRRVLLARRRFTADDRLGGRAQWALAQRAFRDVRALRTGNERYRQQRGCATKCVPTVIHRS
jgi:hypothetical protein